MSHPRRGSTTGVDDAAGRASALELDRYGLIGDSRTAALCSAGGAIDWMCVPRFDGDPIFGRLVDPRGGYWAIAPVDGEILEHAYEPGTPVLRTTWRTRSGTAVVTDALVADVATALAPRVLLVRSVECTEGDVEMASTFAPRLGIPARAPSTSVRAGALVCMWGTTAAAIANDGGLRSTPEVEERWHLRKSETVTFSLSVTDREPLVVVAPSDAAGRVRSSARWWRDWSDGLRYDGAAREHVVRSAITLRLLTYAPSGAPVASPTTSVPALPGSGRAWDYRYAWPRDAGIGTGAFLAVGSVDEPRAFLHWLLHASRLSRPKIDVLYTLDGRRAHGERSFTGREPSDPIRIGNAAASQVQLDVYGWVVQAAAGLEEAGERLDAQTWRAMASLADLVAHRWKDPDHGVWEIRDDPRHHVHSKMMAWSALDDVLQLSSSRRARATRHATWLRARDEIARAIRQRGTHPDGGWLVRAFGSEDVDASCLLLPAIGLEAPDSPLVHRTIDRVRGELSAGGPLLYRYAPGSDGLEGTEGAFVACSFWLAQALAISGRADEAEEVLERMCALATPLGLFAEQIDPTTRAHAGNFPQALSHSTLVHAAAAVSAARASHRAGRRTPDARGA